MIETIQFRVTDHVAYVTLDLPGEKKRVDQQTAQELTDVCRRIRQDDKIFVVLLTGTGNTFCVGTTTLQSEFIEAISTIECPVIAAINGDAINEGLEIALACDIRMASDSAKFGIMTVKSSRIPRFGGTQRLPRLVGKAKALELLLTGDLIDAGEAFKIGLINNVMPDDTLKTRANEFALSVAGKGPVALCYVKEAINQGLDLTLAQGLRLEADLYFLLQTTSDRSEGIKAFREKRPPHFKGE